MDERSSLGTVSKRGCFFLNARARNTHIEATLNHPFAAQVVLAFDGGDPAPFLRAMAGAFPGDAPASVAAARAAALSLPVPRSLRRLLAGVCRGDVVADGARLRVAHAARQDPDDDESADAALRRTVARLGGAAE